MNQSQQDFKAVMDVYFIYDVYPFLGSPQNPVSLVTFLNLFSHQIFIGGLLRVTLLN